MGKAHKERLQRILAGIENPIAQRALQNNVQSIRIQSTDVLIDRINSRLGRSDSQSRATRLYMEQTAESEMRKGVLRLASEKKEPTVDLLLEDYRAAPRFQKMALNAGLDEQYFIDLANKEIDRWKAENGG